VTFPPEIWVFSAIVGMAYGWLKATSREHNKNRHMASLRNIERMERENKWLDAHRDQSQKLSPPWVEPTR
jgi:hypothetical protein